MIRFLVVLGTLTLAGTLLAEPAVPANDVIGEYQQALQRQQEKLKNVSMDVTMEAMIPRLNKQGKMSALRRISNLGKITYKVLGFSGDDTVKKEVIARYMTAEVEAAAARTADIAITPANYHFKYKGMIEMNGRRSHIFELKPKQKRVGLFKGELWVDRETSLPVREQGRFVKSPSVFIKKVDFVRNYEIRDGVAYLTHMESKTDTRIVGIAQLNIDYANYHEAEAADAAVENAQTQNTQTQ